MLGPIGMQELIIIFVIALIVFGPRKLPSLGKSLGRSLAEFKRASNDLRNTLEQEIRVEETRKEIMEPIETIRDEATNAVSQAKSLGDASTETPAEPTADSSTDGQDEPVAEPSFEAQAEEKADGAMDSKP